MTTEESMQDEHLALAFEANRQLRAENAQLRYHLAELGKVADRAGLVIATIEGEDSGEDAELQEIINGISTWAAPAILGEIMQPIPCTAAEQNPMSHGVPAVNVGALIRTKSRCKLQPALLLQKASHDRHRHDARAKNRRGA